MNTKETILIIGSSGQIGTELVKELRNRYGVESVIAADIKTDNKSEGPYEQLDILDRERLFSIIRKYEVSQVYLLAALLSATAESKPLKAWELNMDGLLNVLELAKEGHIRKIYWPSSIAVFGPSTPRLNTPQTTVMEPSTVYGISKMAGERWCEYYFKKYGVDVRSLRYPGLIGYQSEPGGGTTDYAVHIFHEALEKGHYTSFLGAETRLPMMYMPDGIRATIEIMDAPAEKINIRSSYNLAAMSFTPDELAREITKHIPSFSMNYEPDFRQQIADSWPAVIDDSAARNDWGWVHQFDLARMTDDMLVHLRSKNASGILAGI
jgi:nucleoside-diphosphate-sugar epimerase